VSCICSSSSSRLCLLHIWDHQGILPCLAYLLRWSLTNFLPRLASNCYPSKVCFLSCWDYRYELQHLAKKISF
jgi:hypothetical protein